MVKTNMSPIIPSRYGHPKYNSFPQKSRATSLGGIKGVSQRGTPGSDSKSRRKQRLEENKITVQPTEDEEADNFYSKHLAAARFQRNHRLINILFSEVVVDQEQNADNEKLQACRLKRIKSLEEYRDKINKEIVELEEKFNAKRMKIIEDGKKFNENLTEFIENSRKEITALRAAQEVRRQKELTLRQQAPKPDSTTATTAATSTTTTTSLTPTTPATKTTPTTSNVVVFNSSSEIGSNHNEVVPMEVESKNELIVNKDEIQRMLDDIIGLVAKAV